MTDPRDLATLANDPAVPYEVEFHESIGSTNDRARELAAEGRAGVVVLADAQTGGRGRRGRAWTGPPGGVYLSLLLDPDLPAVDVPLLTLAAGVAVARAARERGVDARIKWPNDVLVPVDGEERKLAGVLTERTGDRVVVGVGVNAEVSPADLPAGATSLRALVGDRELDRRAFVVDLLTAFDSLAADPGAVLPAWRDLAITLGRRVRVETPDGEVVGEAVDVEHPGRLLVETDAGPVRVDAGDCRHLRPVRE